MWPSLPITTTNRTGSSARCAGRILGIYLGDELLRLYGWGNANWRRLIGASHRWFKTNHSMASGPAGCRPALSGGRRPANGPCNRCLNLFGPGVGRLLQPPVGRGQVLAPLFVAIARSGTLAKQQSQILHGNFVNRIECNGFLEIPQSPRRELAGAPAFPARGTAAGRLSRGGLGEA